MEFCRRDLSNEQLVHFYKSILLPRMIEEKMLVLLRQGKISKWFSGIGQEAIAVGATLALQQDEWIMPLHRNLGVFTARNMPLHKLFLQWQGNQSGYSNGRERSFHFGSKENRICGMISHLGPQLAVADGVALAHVLKNDEKIALAFSGEGGTSEGDFHEALNLAAVWDLPVIILIENNGYALSTPVAEQYRCESLVHKAKGYGIEGVQIDGNNILAVYDTVKGVREYCIRNKKPYLIVCNTFRMRGHEEASGVKYVPPHMFEEWAKKDPVKKFEEYLILENIITYSQIEALQKEIRTYIEEELQKAEISEHEPAAIDTARELHDIYAPRIISEEIPVIENSYEEEENNVRFIDAVSNALEQSLKKHDNLVIMGQDIAEYGGAFKITNGFVEKFGKARIRNTPICESAVIGAALGMSLEGYKAVVEMQFADFVTMGFNQIVNNLAKIYYRWKQSADVVIRMPTGAGVAAGPFHSQSNEAWFAHVPGLKIVYPSNPFDAKGLLIAAINDPNPVMYFEHKALYRSITGKVSQAYYEVEIGKAFHVLDGTDISVITYGMGVHWALEYAAQYDVSMHITDLRTLSPLDYNSIRDAVKKTGKVLVLHEDTLTGGIGGEIAAWISEHCFEYLDAPVLRCASLDTPVPFNRELEENFLAKARLHDCVQKLLKY